MTTQPIRIDTEYANRCWDNAAKPASELGDQPAINYWQFRDIIEAIYAHGVASEAVLGDLANWKPTGFLNGANGELAGG